MSEMLSGQANHIVPYEKAKNMPTNQEVFNIVTTIEKQILIFILENSGAVYEEPSFFYRLKDKITNHFNLKSISYEEYPDRNIFLTEAYDNFFRSKNIDTAIKAMQTIQESILNLHARSMRFANRKRNGYTAFVSEASGADLKIEYLDVLNEFANFLQTELALSQKHVKDLVAEFENTDIVESLNNNLCSILGLKSELDEYLKKLQTAFNNTKLTGKELENTLKFKQFAYSAEDLHYVVYFYYSAFKESMLEAADIKIIYAFLVKLYKQKSNPTHDQSFLELLDVVKSIVKQNSCLQNEDKQGLLNKFERCKKCFREAFGQD